MTASTSRITALIDYMITKGELSPAARDMDPSDVFHQHAEALAMDDSERRALYGRAGLNLNIPVESLVEGDLVDLEPLLIAWGARDETYEADLMVAQSEYAVVEDTAVAQDGSVIIRTDQMNLAVPAGTVVEIQPVAAD